MNTDPDDDGEWKPDENELFSSIRNEDTSEALKIINENRTNGELLGSINFEDKTPLLKAIQNNMPEVALALIQTGLSKPGYEDEEYNDNSILYYAIQQTKNNKEMEQVVFALLNLDTGEVDPGHIEFNDTTPLMLACSNKLSEIALRLIATGKSNPKYVNENGEDALAIAKELNMTEVVDALIQLLDQEDIDEVDEIQEEDEINETVDINMNDECFDPINRENKPIAEFLSEDEDNFVMIFYTDSSTPIRVGFNREYLKKDNFDYIVYACKDFDTLRPDNIIKGISYYDIKLLCGFGDLVTKRVFVKMKQSSEKIFAFKRRPEPLLTTVSLRMLKKPDSFSTRRCQQNQQAYVYNLVTNVNQLGKRQRDDEDNNSGKRQRIGGTKRRKTNKRHRTIKRRRTNKCKTNKRRRTNKRRTNKRRTNKRRL